MEMRTNAVIILGFSLVACAAHTAPARESRSAIPLSASSAPPIPKPARNRCLSDGLSPAESPPARARDCASPTAWSRPALKRIITDELRRHFRPTIRGSTVDVHFDCDPLGYEDVTEIVFEEGSGHGGNLVSWTLSRAASAPSFQIHGFALQGETHVASGEIEASTVAVPLERVRAWLTASVREVMPMPKPNELQVSSILASSRDFYVLLRLASEHRVLERSFVGYEGSDAQSSYLPVELAADAFRPVVARMRPVSRAPNDDERRVFEQRFLDAEPQFSNPFAWWVRERYVALGAGLGTRALVPALVRLLEPTGEDPSDIRTRDEAIAALAAITGWDARAADDGTKRSSEEAARAYMAECGGNSISR